MSVKQIRNDASGQCIDSACKPEDLHKPVGLWPCHKQGGNQVSNNKYREQKKNKKESVTVRQKKILSLMFT